MGEENKFSILNNIIANLFLMLAMRPTQGI